MMQRKVQKVVDAVGGLIRLHKRRELHALDLGYASQRRMMRHGQTERYCPPLSCYRTVSQRSLSTHANFLAVRQDLDWGQFFAGPLVGLFSLLLTDAFSATPAGAIPPPEGDSLRFYDADRQLSRARIDGMVLIGLRANVSAAFTFGHGPQPTTGPDFDAGELVESLKDFVRDYVSIAVYGSADDQLVTNTVGRITSPPWSVPGTGPDELGEPWVAPTPLRYFDRPGAEFLPVPPLMWRGRDPNCQILVHKGDYGTGTNPQYHGQIVPEFQSQPTGASVVFENVNATLSIGVEALYVPSPEDCGDLWPGVLCPTHKIGGHPDYRPEWSRWEPKPSNIPTKTKCVACGHSETNPRRSRFGVMDPRHNVWLCVHELVALEEHTMHPKQWCPDCLRKHLAKLESFGNEGVTLDSNGGELGVMCSRAAEASRQWWGEFSAIGWTFPEGATDEQRDKMRRQRFAVGAKMRELRKRLLNHPELD